MLLTFTWHDPCQGFPGYYCIFFIYFFILFYLSLTQAHSAPGTDLSHDSPPVQDQYMAKDIEPRAHHGPQYTQRPSHPLDATTTYGTAYQQFELPQKLPYASPAARPQQPFDGTTTSASTYVAHEMQARGDYGPPRMERPHVPFEGSSTMQVQLPLQCIVQRARGLVTFAAHACSHSTTCSSSVVNIQHQPSALCRAHLLSLIL